MSPIFIPPPILIPPSGPDGGPPAPLWLVILCLALLAGALVLLGVIIWDLW